MADLHPFRAGTLTVTDDMRTSLRSLSAPAVTDKDFSAIVTGIAAQLAGEPGAAAIDISSTPAAARLGAAKDGGVRVLQALMVDYAKVAASPAAVKSALEENSLSAARAALFADIYAAHLENIRTQAIAAAATLPQLIGLTWRLDYFVSSKEVGKVGMPTYRVQLQFAQPASAASASAGGGSGSGSAGRTWQEEFCCSPQELEDLTAKVKEAVRTASALVKAVR